MKHRRHRHVQPLAYRQLCVVDTHALSDESKKKLDDLGIVVIEKGAGRHLEFVSVDTLGQGVKVVQTKEKE